MKTYELYASSPGARFTTRISKYYDAPPESRCMYKVRARSVKQAYALARKEVWASGPKDTGLVKRKVGGKTARWEKAPYLIRVGVT